MRGRSQGRLWRTWAAASLVALGAIASANARDVAIGVLAFRGEGQAIERWSATADYLNGQIPEHRFRVVPLTLTGMDEVALNDKVDFILTNPGNYVMLESRYGASRIATLRSRHRSEAGNAFGAVIFTRADRSDIKTLEDLKGKTFMAVEPAGFGGFQMAWREFRAHGIDPQRDFKELRFSGFPQDAIAYAVRDGKVDAGTFRTDALETMAREGLIDLAEFRVLNRRDNGGFSALFSTRLYPEWPFAKLKQTPATLAQKVAIALLSMPADNAAAVKGKYAGWTVPSDYQPVHDLFRELKIGPYENLGQISFTAILSEYWQWLVLSLVVVVLSIGRAASIEQQVARRTRELSAANAELERQISERRRAEEEARQHQAELAHVYRVGMIGEMASNIAHEINQPLSAIASYAQGCVRRLKSGRDGGELLTALEGIAQQAERAGAIVRRIRNFVRKETPAQRSVDVNVVIGETLQLLESDAQRQGVAMQFEPAEYLPAVAADPVQLQQVVLNLARNGVEAMADTAAPRRRLIIATAIGEGDTVEIAVRDCGPGLSADQFKRVFEPFFTTKSGGLGLGLSICRSIIEDHGGRIAAENAEDGGALFRIRLPAAKQERAA